MMGTSSGLAALIMFATVGGGDFSVEKSSMLVTKAKMTQINFGQVMLYEDGRFYHDKGDQPVNKGGSSEEGFYVLDAKQFSKTRIPAKFVYDQTPKKADSDFNYYLSMKSVVSLLSGIMPESYQAVENGANNILTLRPELLVDTYNNLTEEKSAETFLVDTKFIPTPDPKAKPGTAPKGKYEFVHNGISYHLKIGNPEALKKEYEQLSIGMNIHDNDSISPEDIEKAQQAGANIYSQHFYNKALRIAILPVNPENELLSDEERKEVELRELEEITDWYIVRHKLKAVGHVVYPVIVDENFVNQASSRQPKSFVATSVTVGPRVRNSKTNEIIKFRFPAKDFIQKIFAKRMEVENIEEYACKESTRTNYTACKSEQVKTVDKSGKTITENVQMIEITLNEDLNKLDGMTRFKIWNEKERDDTYSVSIHIDSDPTYIRSQKVSPVSVIGGTPGRTEVPSSLDSADEDLSPGTRRN